MALTKELTEEDRQVLLTYRQSSMEAIRQINCALWAADLCVGEMQPTATPDVGVVGESGGHPPMVLLSGDHASALLTPLQALHLGEAIKAAAIESLDYSHTEDS